MVDRPGAGVKKTMKKFDPNFTQTYRCAKSGIELARATRFALRDYADKNISADIMRDRISHAIDVFYGQLSFIEEL